MPSDPGTGLQDDPMPGQESDRLGFWELRLGQGESAVTIILVGVGTTQIDSPAPGPFDVVGGIIAGIGIAIGGSTALDQALDIILQAERPRGTWPADTGAREWDRRTGGGRTGQDKFHDIKQHSPWRGGTQDWSVDPETGDVYSPDGEIEGNLND